MLRTLHKTKSAELDVQRDAARRLAEGKGDGAPQVARAVRRRARVAVGAPVAVNASTESAASPDLHSKIILFLVDIFGQAASFGSQCVSAMNGRLCR